MGEILSVVERYAGWVPDWLIASAALPLAAGLALLFHRTVVRVVWRLVSPRHEFLQSLIAATQTLTRVALVIVAIAIVLPVVPLGREAASVVAHGLFVAFIVLLGWSASIAITLGTDFYLWRSNITAQRDLLARKHVTQVRVLRRVMATLVVIITIAAALMTFKSVKQYGVSLIASTGAAGIVVGYALAAPSTAA